MSVCSRHFLASDFIPRAPGAITKRKCLKKNAVPSVNLPQRTHDRLPLSLNNQFRLQRQRKREKRRVLLQSQELQNSERIKKAEVTVSHQVSNSASNPLNILAEVCAHQERNSDILHDELVDICKESSALTGTYMGFSVLEITKDSKKLRTFTGLPSIEVFDEIVKNCIKIIGASFTKMPVQGFVLIVLIKVKLNLPFIVIATLFNVPVTTCTRYFHNSVFLLAQVLKTCITWPERNEIACNIPKCFKGFEPVRVVLDCTEISVEKPKCLKCRILTYSHYKGNNTVKFLIGVSPTGLVTFVSDAYGGRASDKHITLDSGVLDKLDPFIDSVMVDKGFSIDEECESRCIRLIRPAFVKGGMPLSEMDSIRSTSVAKARVHVERAIQRLKMFGILKRTLDWFLLKDVKNLMDIAAGIVNLSSPILSDDRF